MNWQNLVAGLIESGMTQTEIAEAAGCTQAFISGLYTGAKKGCDYDTGVILVRLSERVKAERKQAA